MNKPLAIGLLLVALTASTSQAAWAGNYHNKTKLVRPFAITSERVRNAQAYVVATPFANNFNTTHNSYSAMGREVSAPPWSAAGMTDHGPSVCGQPMWVYGNPGAVARYSSGF